MPTGKTWPKAKRGITDPEKTLERSHDTKLIKVIVRHQRYRREYRSTITLSIPTLSKSGTSWVSEVLELLANESIRQPLEESNVRPLRYALSAVFAEPNLAIVWESKLQDLSVRALEELFTRIERRLEENLELSNQQRYFASHEFRSLCARTLPRLQKSELGPVLFRFKTRFQCKSIPRRLISDAVIDGMPPQGAMPYEDPRLLKEAMLNRSRDVLQRIGNAALEDLDGAQRLRALLNELKQEVTDSTYIDFVRKITKTKTYSKTHYALENFANPRAYIGALVHVYDDDLWAKKGTELGILHGIKVDRFILEKASWNAKMTKPWRARSFATLPELFSCDVILQCATTWNVSSVLALRLEDIEAVEDGYIIQSFKEKTNTHTPPVKLVGNQSDDNEVVDASIIARSSEAAACRAIELLIWNHRQLVAYGHQNEEDTQLFHSAFSLTRASGTLSIQHLSNEFIERHGLMQFSVEQLRNEKLFEVSLGSIDKAQRDGGHASVKTTGSYVYQVQFAKRYYSSQNLRFQRDWEEEIRGLLLKTVTKEQVRLMRPIGDGASCADPNSPPWRDVGDRSECLGDRCHAYGGCGNRVLEISSDRIKEALLCEKVYQENWPALLAQNQHAFREFHVPRILFNTSFLHMVSGSSIAHVLPKLRREFAVTHP